MQEDIPQVQMYHMLGSVQPSLFLPVAILLSIPCPHLVTHAFAFMTLDFIRIWISIPHTLPKSFPSTATFLIMLHIQCRFGLAILIRYSSFRTYIFHNSHPPTSFSSLSLRSPTKESTSQSCRSSNMYRVLHMFSCLAIARTYHRQIRMAVWSCLESYLQICALSWILCVDAVL